MALTLDQLLATRTREQLVTDLLARLNGSGFPVTDWYPGSVAHTLLRMYAEGQIDSDTLGSAVVAGGFVGLAAALKNPDGSDNQGWLDLLLEQNFNLTRTRATYCKQRVRMWCNAGAGPYPFTAGQFVLTNPKTGHIFRNTGSGTVLAGGVSGGSPYGTLNTDYILVDIQAESPGSVYNANGANTIDTVITPLPGLRCLNVQPSFGGVDPANGRALLNGYGSGTVTPSGTPALARSYRLSITASGQVTAGSATLEITNSSGVTTTLSFSPIPASYAGAGDGVTIAFANGAVNPSFVVGDVYTFTTPGSPIIQAGTDDETNEAYAERGRLRWPELSLIPTDGRYVSWIKQCSKENLFGITKISPSPSEKVGGQVEILIATAGGAPGGSIVSTVQTYLDKRRDITDRALVQGAVGRDIYAGGSAVVRASELTAVQAKADTLWAAYLAGLPIGGDKSTSSLSYGWGVVRVAELTQAVMDAGAISCAVEVNAAPVDCVLSYNEVATMFVAPSSGIVWNVVP